MVGLQRWSPTSKLVAFLSTTSTSYDLWLLHSTSAVPVQPPTIAVMTLVDLQPHRLLR
ncbi:hypothetical protein Hdeb2414_s0010g00358381 [Helianthus debilis subsp. tardiflorus]